MPLLVPVADLELDPDNVRRHEDFNLDTIAASLRNFGQVEPVIVRPSGRLIAGEGRLQAIARDPELRWTHVARVVFRGSEEEARRLALVHNRSAELATWDPENLSAVLDQIRKSGGDSDVLELGWHGDDVDALLDIIRSNDPASARQPEFDESAADGYEAKTVTCPECGCAFTP